MNNYINRDNNNITKNGKKINCVLEVVTPLHIGSGQVLHNDIDFIKDSTTVKIIRNDDLIKYLEENNDELDRFIKGNYKLSALEKLPNEITKEYIFSLSVSEIREFERNGFGNPYIPGSSIKGAIRSALLNYFVSSVDKGDLERLILRKGKKEYASKELLKEIFGKNPNYNFMRVIEVFDAHFNHDDIELYDVYILSLKNKHNFGWKNLQKRFNTKDLTEATPIVAEFIPNNFATNFTMKLDEFTLNKLFGDSEINSLGDLAKIVNQYSKEFLKSERVFFNRLNSKNELESVIKNIDKLLDTIPKTDDEMLLKVGWGGGWKGMTGNYVDDEELLEKIRKDYRLGKREFEFFPKTRRIVFEGDTPKFLTGWVKIKFNKELKSDKKINKVESNEEEEMDALERLKQKFKVTKLK